MVGKKHKNLLQDIRTYIKYLSDSNNGLKVQPVEFFVESAYEDAKGEERPYFEVTEKGCEMIAQL